MATEHWNTANMLEELNITGFLNLILLAVRGAAVDSTASNRAQAPSPGNAQQYTKLFMASHFLESLQGLQSKL